MSWEADVSIQSHDLGDLGTAYNFAALGQSSTAILEVLEFGEVVDGIRHILVLGSRHDSKLGARLESLHFAVAIEADDSLVGLWNWRVVSHFPANFVPQPDHATTR